MFFVKNLFGQTHCLKKVEKIIFFPEKKNFSSDRLKNMSRRVDVYIAKLEGKVISYKSLLIEWCQKEKKLFNYEVYDDNGNDGQKYFGVRLSIDDKVIAKARATSKKKAEEKASQRAYFAFQEKIDNK